MRTANESLADPILRPYVGRFTGTIFVLIGIATVVTPFLEFDVATIVSSSLIMLGTSLAGGILLRKAPGLPLDERLAWRMVGAGFLLIAAGIGVLAFTWAFTSYTAAFGPPDLLYLLGYGVGMAGLATLPHVTGNRLQRIRLLIDGIIGAVAITALLWVFLFAEVAKALADSPTWERVIGSAFPLLDIMLLVVVMIVIVRRSSYRFDPRLVFIATGVVTQTAADIVFLLTGAGKSFGEAQPVFPLHILTMGFFLAAAVTVDHATEARQYADRPATPVWAMVLPYGTAAGMVLVLLMRVRWTALVSSDLVLFLATLVVAILVVVRQSVAIRENRRFVEKQRNALVASISHELRTPLTAMVGFVDLLASDEIDDPSERREMTNIVNQQTTYLSRIVSDLVMLASGDNSTIELDITATAIDELAWSSINAAAIDPANVHVDAERGVTAFLDTGRAQQALANILANAERYGGDRILVVATTSGGDLVLEIHDNGPGVPRKHELMIWEKFERGPNRLNATVPGSGIGLAVSAAIVKAHGGSVGYRRSERLGGACFWIRLPGRVHADPSYSASDGSASLSVVANPRDIKSA